MASKEPTGQAVLVVGLGRFGSSIAEALDRMGHEVLAVDKDPAIVQEWSGRLTHVIEADSATEEALRQIGAADFSIAVVGIGTSIESSVLTTVTLSDLGIKQIWAKAITPAHGKILERIGATKVVYPERDAGERVAHLVSGKLMDFIEFDDGFAIVKMAPPQETRGLHAGRVAGPGEVRRHGGGREVTEPGLHLCRAEHQDQPARPADRQRPDPADRALRRPPLTLHPPRFRSLKPVSAHSEPASAVRRPA